jgi:hypothetical protein
MNIHVASKGPQARGWCVMVRVLLAVLLLLLGAPPCVNPQGLDKNPDALLAASNAYNKIKLQMQMGIKWRKEFRDNPKAACSNSKASLCSSSPELGNGEDPEDVRFWMTAPPVYDQRKPKHTGGFNAVSRPLDQGKCNTCASFAVASAAETAIAMTLRPNATHMISIQVHLQWIHAHEAAESNTVSLHPPLSHACPLIPQR